MRGYASTFEAGDYRPAPASEAECRPRSTASPELTAPARVATIATMEPRIEAEIPFCSAWFVAGIVRPP
jgi:hypothetical protein